MSEENCYGGPAVERTRDRERLLARRKNLIGSLARRIHANQILTWAQSDDGRYPSKIDALHEAAFEVETLMMGLGEWSAVDPGLWESVRGDAGVWARPRPRSRRDPWASLGEPWEPEDWDDRQ